MLIVIDYVNDWSVCFFLSELRAPELRRALACTNAIENMMGTVRRVCRNVKRWRNADMALRWTAAGMMEPPRVSVA